MPVYPGARRGRDGHRWPPPAQIRTGGITAYGSSLGYERRSVHSGRDARCAVQESTDQRQDRSPSRSPVTSGSGGAVRIAIIESAASGNAPTAVDSPARRDIGNNPTPP